jgi:hypothetical protein
LRRNPLFLVAIDNQVGPPKSISEGRTAQTLPKELNVRHRPTGALAGAAGESRWLRYFRRWTTNIRITKPIDHQFPPDFLDESRDKVKTESTSEARDFNTAINALGSGKEQRSAGLVRGNRPRSVAS